MSSLIEQSSKLAHSEIPRSAKFPTFAVILIACVVMAGWFAAVPCVVQAYEDPVPEAEDDNAVPEGGEVLGRGPVHEAFAGLAPLTPQASPTIAKAPPDPIQEIPPQAKPEGDDVLWIPGYWAWDDDKSDYIWVSGVWRKAPPGTHWIPGYWNEVDGGYQWVAGYWAPQGDAAGDGAPPSPENLTPPGMDYLPSPPESLENGPTSDPPGPNFLWIPGSWLWIDDHYVWRPGYWLAAREDWVWIPDQYVYTPAGCAFVPGYWDYPFQRRGLLFAPMYFSGGGYLRPGFQYSPYSLVNLGLLAGALWGRPNYGHYYYGDYYGSRYSGLGYHPWFGLNRFAYNPMYDHARWYYGRNNPGWYHGLQQQYHERLQNPQLRPSRGFGPGGGPGGQGSPLIVNVRQQLATGGRLGADTAGHNWQLQKISAANHAQLVQHVQTVQALQQQRVDLEKHAHAGLPAQGNPTRPVNPTGGPKGEPGTRPITPVVTHSWPPRGIGPTHAGEVHETPHSPPAHVNIPHSPVMGPQIHEAPTRPTPPPAIHHTPPPHVAPATPTPKPTPPPVRPTPPPVRPTPPPVRPTPPPVRPTPPPPTKPNPPPKTKR